MNHLIKVIRALSDKNRIMILKLLKQRGFCVCELHTLLEISQPTVSSHLRILQEAGLIEYQKDGRWVIYQFSKIEDSHIAQAIDHILKSLDSDQEIKSLLINSTKIDRHNLCQIKRD